MQHDSFLDELQQTLREITPLEFVGTVIGIVLFMMMSTVCLYFLAAL